LSSRQLAALAHSAGVIDQFINGQPGERTGGGWERLRCSVPLGRRPSAGRSSIGHTGLPMIRRRHKETVFARQCDGLDLPSHIDIGKNRGEEVIVPDRMMHDLEMPLR
jgi:hypothetical protein